MRFNKKPLIFLLCLAVIVGMFIPFTAYADDSEHKVIRVGWYDSSYNTIDENGFRTGYAYEYQLKLSAYNGWTYEYVKGSWSELLHMLETGEIDLMSDVSYTEKREESMYFSTLPMGTEEYYLFIAPYYDDISPTNKSTVNGKKVGVNKDSIQADLYKEWEEDNNVHAEIILVTCSENESLEMLENGELDAYVTVDSFLDSSRAVPVYKIGSSDFYFAVSKNRPDLLDDLDYAMNKIQDENRYYNMEMYEKYIRRIGANGFLSTKEIQWLNRHGAIKVGYQDNYLSFCASDENGQLTGVLKDYLELAADCIPNAHLDFKTIAYPTAEEAMNALKRREIDCVFPANLNGYEAEMQDMVMTPTLMNTEMYAVVRVTDPNIFAKKETIKVAVNKGNPNYDAFLAKHYPNWERVYYDDSEECLKAVAAEAADCLIISNYRYNNIARLCEKYFLTTFSLGIDMDYCFAVNTGQTELYSVLAKVIGMIPDSNINAALTHYIAEEAKVTVKDFLMDNLGVIMAITGVVVLIILALLIQNMWAVSKARSLISATEIDDLTGLYNRKYFFQYANRMHREHPDIPLDAIVINIEQFHSINELHGRDLGDQILTALGNEISQIAKESNGIAGRFEADRFDIYCQQKEDYESVFKRLQAKLDELAPNANIRLRMGIMPWSEKLIPVQLFDRARTACNMARGNYTKHLIVYDDTVSKRESYEQRLVNDLRHALDAHEFEVFYQPKYDIQVDPPKFVSVEALVRWRHPELGMITPEDFIPLFEKNGQISLLDNFVWCEAARQIAEWKEKYGMVIPVSVNLSRVDVFDPSLEETLEDILKQNGLEHDAFKLEVTESAYTENADQVIQVVGGLRNKGFEVEMDDFGSGYSSLNMLSSMPIDVLKMDREFVRNIDHNEKDQQLVELILDIARSLKVPVIAEGVERETQLQLLKTMGCAMVQGFYFSRPLPADEFEKRILNNL